MRLFDELKKRENKEKAIGVQRFFKEEVKSLGIYVPIIRKTVTNYMKSNSVNLEEEFYLLWNKNFLESRFAAIFLLGSSKLKNTLKLKIFLSVLKDKNLNWAYVDFISSYIGKMILSDITILKKLKKLTTGNNWEKRVSIVSLIMPMRKNVVTVDFVLKMIEHNIYSDWEYLHKASGWVLRECYKKDKIKTTNFLKNKKNIPRICFSYACEKMNKQEKDLLKLQVY